MRKALTASLAALLAATLPPLAQADGMPASPSASAPAVTAPASSTQSASAAAALPQPRPSDAELARRRMRLCKVHPEICVQDKKEGEKEKRPAPEGNPK